MLKPACKSEPLLRFTLRSLIFQITEVFGFSIGHNGEFETVGKKLLKIGISNFKTPQSSFVRTTGRNIQDKCEKFWLCFVRGTGFDISLPLGLT